MMTFKIDLEVIASHKQELKIPPELMDAYIINRLGWSYETLNNTPYRIIEQILFIWHLEKIAEKSANSGKHK